MQWPWFGRRKLMIALALTLTLMGIGVYDYHYATIPVSIRGNNHENVPMEYFTAGGGDGLDYGEGSGETCCVEIPARWRPGLKVKVHWRRTSRMGEHLYGEPMHVAEVELAPYAPEPNSINPDLPPSMGNLYLHFYPNHGVKAIVTNYSEGSPYFPYRKLEQAKMAYGKPTMTQAQWDQRNLKEEQEEERRRQEVATEMKAAIEMDRKRAQQAASRSATP